MGRTNRIWRLDGDGAPLVCKLFNPDGGTDLFPNDNVAETLALRALKDTGIAPELLAELSTKVGCCILYAFTEGGTWTHEFKQMASSLAALHRFAPPSGFRQIPSGMDAVISQGARILSTCHSGKMAQLSSMKPTSERAGPIKPVFLHGDAVPANAILSDSRVVLIDWQCPAIGDPCEDLATFLSSAMQFLYGGKRLSLDEENQFLAAYACPKKCERFNRMRPAFDWRMAAHCLWKVENGEPDYAAGLELEIAALEKL